MWIFKNNAFVSIVEDKDWPDALWVRARVAGDLERFFEGTDAALDVIETPDADYRFRVCVSREIAAKAVTTAVESVDYVNFKNSISNDKAGDRRHHAYLDVWRAMFRFQLSELKFKPKKGKKKAA